MRKHIDLKDGDTKQLQKDLRQGSVQEHGLRSGEKSAPASARLLDTLRPTSYV